MPDGVIEFEVKGLTAKIDAADAAVLSRRWKLKRTGRHVCLVRNLTLKNRTCKGLYLHRMIVGAIPKGMQVDHINGDGLDNRRSNLRVVTPKENLRNISHREAVTSLAIGVRKRRNRFNARIVADGKTHLLGTFDTKEEAETARLLAEERLWGIQPRRAVDIQCAKDGMLFKKEQENA